VEEKKIEKLKCKKRKVSKAESKIKNRKRSKSEVKAK
jgi:hypothetical protein